MVKKEILSRIKNLESAMTYLGQKKKHGSIGRGQANGYLNALEDIKDIVKNAGEVKKTRLYDFWVSAKCVGLLRLLGHKS